ncbi:MULTISPECIES: hypothetical protein [unclassified Crossiella]|uniref:hypothetical protein n=1 Tax=unclassified Crossiella TaxID=2620835 RepID=UPI001FFEB866|nr:MULTISPECIES: hypothetical protein [unclassified Crossiella]MCK2236410.1 hypothetical protein [Crossiella sp. S99.2]MCK2250077.1 hypothetical protein [Crossiella sp. S99.1]
MGLLVGAKIAANFLSLTDGSKHLLPTIFPAVEHVGRFNLTSAAARDVLIQADQHLGMMAVPYALALHEDLLRSCITLAGGTAPQSVKHLHRALETCTGGTFRADPLAQFHVLREMRNSVIHNGGVIDQRVPDCAGALSPMAAADWKRIVGRSPVNLAVGVRIELGVGEMFMALATTKNVAKDANRMLTAALPSARWAQLIVADYLAHGPPAKNAAERHRKLRGWARFHYTATGVSETELVTAAHAAGLHV